jgi:hypothetical protein
MKPFTSRPRPIRTTPILFKLRRRTAAAAAGVIVRLICWDDDSITFF